MDCDLQVEKTWWGIDGEDFKYLSLFDLIADYDLGPDDEVISCSGDYVMPASLFDVGDFLQQLQAQATMINPEWEDVFLQCSDEEIQRLDLFVKTWLNRNGMADFLEVESIGRYKVAAAVEFVLSGRLKDLLNTNHAKVD